MVTPCLPKFVKIVRESVRGSDAQRFCRETLESEPVPTCLRTEEWVGIACRIGMYLDNVVIKLCLQEVCNLNICGECTIQLITLVLTLVIVIGSNRVVVVVEWTVDT